MDAIQIAGLEVYAHHGVHPEETALGQKFVVSAVLWLDTRQAGVTDDLTASVHYGHAAHFIADFLTQHTYALIEAAAEQLARALLLRFPVLSAVDLTLGKPWAPIGLPLETVSVSIHRARHTAYLALGSNLGDRKKYLDDAVRALDADEDSRVIRVSSYRETEPYGGVEQDDFLNGALALETLLTPEELLHRLHEIENAAGRVRTVRWGPRTLDLDILLYDDAVIDTPELTVPHAELDRRDFMLRPLAEIAPWVRDPLRHKTIQEMLQEL